VGYKVFEPQRAYFTSPAVSIRPDGGMRLNAAAAEFLKAKGADRVLLLWDEDKNKIAISVAPKQDTRGFKLHYNTEWKGASFAAKAFFGHIGWKADRTVPLTLTWVNSMFEATLPTANLAPAEHQQTKKGRMRRTKTGL
jgi:hypothetical protein